MSMRNKILVPAAAVLALMAPAASRAQSYSWLQQSWHIKTVYLTGRIRIVAQSSDTRTEYLKEADRIIGLMDSESNADLVQHFRALLVAIDGRNMRRPWEEYRIEAIQDLTKVVEASSSTTAKSVFFVRFDEIIFRSEAK